MFCNTVILLAVRCSDCNFNAVNPVSSSQHYIHHYSSSKLYSSLLLIHFQRVIIDLTYLSISEMMMDNELVNSSSYTTMQSSSNAMHVQSRSSARSFARKLKIKSLGNKKKHTTARSKWEEKLRRAQEETQDKKRR